jgi:hypothetical protein
LRHTFGCSPYRSQGTSRPAGTTSPPVPGVAVQHAVAHESHAGGTVTAPGHARVTAVPGHVQSLHRA